MDYPPKNFIDKILSVFYLLSWKRHYIMLQQIELSFIDLFYEIKKETSNENILKILDNFKINKKYYES